MSYELMSFQPSARSPGAKRNPRGGRSASGRENLIPMKPTPIIFLTIILFGLFLPNGIRAAVFNNLWSVRFIKGAYAQGGVDPRAFSPPATHKHAGMLLANQALKQGDVPMAVEYMAPLLGASEPLVRHTIANLYFLQGQVAPAVDIWKDIGRFHTLEQAYRQLEGDDQILALQAAYDLFPERYARPLVSVLLTRADQLSKGGQTEEAIIIYQRILSINPGQQEAQTALETLVDPNE